MIEYDTPTELQAIKTILAGMPLVLVNNITNGYTYAAGYRVDRNDECRNHTPSITTPSYRLIGRILAFTASTVVTIMSLPYATIANGGISYTALTVWVFIWIPLIAFALGQKIIPDFDFMDQHPIDAPEAHAATA